MINIYALKYTFRYFIPFWEGQSCRT